MRAIALCVYKVSVRPVFEDIARGVTSLNRPIRRSWPSRLIVGLMAAQERGTIYEVTGWTCVAAVVLLPVLAYAYPIYVLPLVRNFAAQDACTFGSVDNARYRELLSTAKALERNTTSVVSHVDPQGSAYQSPTPRAKDAELARRFALVRPPDDDTITGRIAAMHAIMRGMNAVFVGASSATRGLEFKEIFVIDPKIVVAQKARLIFEYTWWSWSSFPLGCIFSCSSTFHIKLQLGTDGPDGDASSERGDLTRSKDEFSFSQVKPSLLEYQTTPVYAVLPGMVCPPTPSRPWAEGYEAALRTAM